MLDIYYSITVIFALLILYIINKNVVTDTRGKEQPGMAEYECFVRSIELFLVVDASWGFVHSYLDNTWLYYDAVIYNVTMILTVLMCCVYVSKFLELQKKKGKILIVFGKGFFAMDIILVIINFFTPVIFWIDENGNYHTGVARQIGMYVLVAVFILIAVIALFAMRGAIGVRKEKISAIAFFSTFITLALFVQAVYPLFPCYSLGLVVAVIIIYVHIHVAEQSAQIEAITMLNNDLRKSHLQIERNSYELLKLKRMLEVTEIGTWELIYEAGKQPRLRTDDKMKELMGIHADTTMSEEEVCTMLIERINPEDIPAFQAYDTQLKTGQRAECTYRWNHPALGEQYLRCGGALVSANSGCIVIRGYHYDVTAQVKTEKELQLSIAANKAKTKFLQNMSHEIRTPLNAMFGFSQLLGMPDGTWEEEEKARYNSIIYNTFNMLDMLINDILDSADIQHGNYRMELGVFNVNEVGRNALSCVEFRRPGHVEMNFSTDLEDSHTVTSDARRVQQILINYLTNACKNTIRGEIHLHISNKQKPGVLTFSVTDTGKGVPPEKAELIFGRYTKLDKNVQGSGLGLNICHTIAEKLGGRVYLDTTYTDGARFILEIEEDKA